MVIGLRGSHGYRTHHRIFRAVGRSTLESGGWGLGPLGHRLTTYARQHVLETVFQSVLIIFPMLLLFRLSASTALVAGLLSAVLQFWIHADVCVHYGRWSTMLVSPLQHRWHHNRDQ